MVRLVWFGHTHMPELYTHAWDVLRIKQNHDSYFVSMHIKYFAIQFE